MNKVVVLTLILSMVLLASCGTREESESVQKSNSTDQKSTIGLIEVEGIYTGQIDSHTIEVKVNNEAKSFYTSPSVLEKLVDLDEGSKIVIKYYENGTGRNEIDEITATE